MGKRGEASCSDCYFKRAGLCALQVESICPTFRHHSRGNLVPPGQPRLVPRTLGRTISSSAAA